MPLVAADSESGEWRARAIAFYLPQFHPIPENDEYWEPGFTEWTNVVRCRPRYPGHYQPHEPGELGYYDLRVREVRNAQAALAREHGIEAFCYYHYWFNGRRPMHRVVDDVLASGEPDLPFCFCWANEDWRRNWDASTGELLVEQTYSDDDNDAHIAWLLEAFKDDRYLKIDGRPIFLIYRPYLIPDLDKLIDGWRRRAMEAGLPGLHLCGVDAHSSPEPAEDSGLDATVGFMPETRRRLHGEAEGYRSDVVVSYEFAARRAIEDLGASFADYPAVVNAWDNSARRDSEATIYDGSTPELYEEWLTAAVEHLQSRPPEQRLVFLVAWNEWAEGNHLEPDRRYGRAYLEATRRALSNSRETPASASPQEHGETFVYTYDYSEDSHLGTIVRLAEEVLAPNSLVVDLGAGAAVVRSGFVARGHRYIGCERDPEALAVLVARGVDRRCLDLSEIDDVIATLDLIENEHGRIGALLLLDVVEHLNEPQVLLEALSAWSRSSGTVPLLVSVPNVAHRDVAVRLLFGRWDPTPTGLLDATHIRFFYDRTLRSLTERAGWALDARADLRITRSDQFSEELMDGVPWAVLRFLFTVAEAAHDNAEVYQFLWRLAPATPAKPLGSFGDAVAGSVDQIGLDEQRLRALRAAVVAQGLASAHEASVVYRPRSEEHAAWVAAFENSLRGSGVVPTEATRPALTALARVYESRADLIEMFGSYGDVDTFALMDWATEWGIESPEARRWLLPYLSEFEELSRGPVTVAFENSLRGSGVVPTEASQPALTALARVYRSRADLIELFGSDGDVNIFALLDWVCRWGIETPEARRWLLPYLSEFEELSSGPVTVAFENSLRSSGVVPTEASRAALTALARVYRSRADLVELFESDGDVNIFALLDWVCRWGIETPEVRDMLLPHVNEFEALASTPVTARLLEVLAPTARQSDADYSAASGLAKTCTTRPDVLEHFGGRDALNCRGLVEWALEWGIARDQIDELRPYDTVYRRWLQQPSPTKSPKRLLTTAKDFARAVFRR